MFKDKPLKKIVCDSRVTVDVLHQQKTSEFQKYRSKKQEYIDELNKLEEQYKQSPNFELNTKMNQLKKNVEKSDPKQEVSYYLDAGMILSDYYQMKKDHQSTTQETSGKISILNFMKKHSEPPKQTINANLINDYLSIIDDKVVNIQDTSNNDVCPQCQQKMFLNPDNSFIFCESCGYTKDIVINSEKVSYKDPPRESSYFAYKRINHFNEWLAQFQAKEATDIPEEVYNGILKELDKNPFIQINDITHKYVREILKRLKFNKYYEHIPHIINILNGKKAPVLSSKYEEQLRMMFKEIQTPFMKHCPEERKNFLSYSYVLHKFCELIELDEFLSFFPLLKSREKLQQQDVIWEKICKELQWQYIPSI
jgi:hypothetical protein